jgi:hypothetical protein
MLFKKIIPVYSDGYTKRINTEFIITDCDTHCYNSDLEGKSQLIGLKS